MDEPFANAVGKVGAPGGRGSKFAHEEMGGLVQVIGDLEGEGAAGLDGGE